MHILRTTFRSPRIYALRGLMAMALFACSSANADSVTYTYTGPQFTSYSGTYSPGIQTNVSATFTLSQPLPPNLMDNPTASIGEGGLILSMSVTDGSFVDTNVQDVRNFLFFTDSQGNITAWDWQILHPVDSFGDVMGVGSYGNWYSFGSEDYAESANGNTGGIGFADEVGTTGTWTLSASGNQTVPEPSSIVLLGAGLLGLAVRTRRKNLFGPAR